MCFDAVMYFKRFLPKTLLLATLPALLLGLAGCGKKGDPLPPLRDVPLRTSDLSVVQQGSVLELRLTYPSATISGMPLGGIDALEVLQLVKPATVEEIAIVPSAEVEAGAEVLLTLRGAELEAALTGDRIQVRVPLAEELPEETVYYFGVRTIKGEETSEVSNVVGWKPAPPPEPPQNLRATARPRSIELTWESDAEVEGFDVFRREARERGYGKPLRRVGAEERIFRDTNVEYGRRYIYTVRAVVGLDPLVLSDEAGEREVDYDDRFAPPLPKNFVALGERSRVRLRWEASAADDVAGYVIYRKEPRRTEFGRVNDELVTGIEYINRGLVAGLIYEFKIQVVDQAGNESELSEAVSVTVR